jgi:ABC-type transport system involved in cytochrome c biogenesis permease subunit
MKDPTRYVPWVIAGLAGLCLLFAAVPRGEAEDEMHLRAFGQLPVTDRGRVKPLDSLARTSLMAISNRQTYWDHQRERTFPAIKWLLEVMTAVPRERMGQQSGVDDLKVFRIENDQVLDVLGLEVRPGSFRYSFNEIRPKHPRLLEQYQIAKKKDAKRRDLFDTKIIHLLDQIGLYSQLKSGFQTLSLAPPSSPGEEWHTLGEADELAKARGEESVAITTYGRMLLAYAKDDPRAFNTALARYRSWLEQNLPSESGKASFEAFFNGFAPFYLCSIVYVLVFLLSCAGWVTQPRMLYRTAFWLAVVALVVHSWALIARMYLSGRPLVFVTNLYSSAVFIGWMSVVLGLVLERIYGNGFGAALSGLVGALTLVIAHNLGNEGDTLEMLRAVLDTNFWLATHVTTVTIGYSATFVAGFLGLAFIVQGLFTTRLKGELHRSLTQMIYGILCFATLFSFVGTVLGGIWADVSWGRFWGWDPKENGALLIVLWNVLVLHARWAGMVKPRGMAVLAVGGNMVTAWSWFGTNQLGVGLHSYGFNNTLALWLDLFWLSQLLVIGLGVIPLSAWRSFAPAQPAAAAPAVVPAVVPVVTPAPAPPTRPVKPGSRKRRGVESGFKKK